MTPADLMPGVFFILLYMAGTFMWLRALEKEIKRLKEEVERARSRG